MKKQTKEAYVLLPIEIWNQIVNHFMVLDNAQSAILRQNRDFVKYMSDYIPKIKYHKESDKWGSVHHDSGIDKTFFDTFDINKNNRMKT